MLRWASLGGLFVVLFLAGCGSSNWQITAENQNDVPCNILVVMGADGHRTAQVDTLKQGVPQVLVAEPNPLPIRYVKMTRNGAVQTQAIERELQPGKTLAIRVDSAGTLSARFE